MNKLLEKMQLAFDQNIKRNRFIKRFNTALTKILLPKKEVYDYIRFVIVLSQQRQENLKIVQSLADRRLAHFQAPNHPVQRFYNDIRDSFVQSASPSLADSLSPYLNDVEKMVVQSSDDIIDALKTIIDNSEKSNQMQKKVIGAAIMPVIYLLAIVLLINATNDGLIGMLIEMVEKSGKEPQGSLAAIRNINELVIQYQPLALPSIAGGFIAYAYWLPRAKGNAREIIERVPLFGIPFAIHRDLSAAAFLNILSALFKAGRPVKEALPLIHSNASMYLREQIQAIEYQFSFTGKIGDSMQCALFKSKVKYLLSIYLTSDNATKHMASVSQQIEKQVDSKTGVVAKVVNLAGIVLVAAYILLLVFANMSMSNYLNT